MCDTIDVIVCVIYCKVNVQNICTPKFLVKLHMQTVQTQIRPLMKEITYLVIQNHAMNF